MNSPWLSLALLGIGLVVSFICGILMLITAFRKHVLWGLAILFVPFAGLLFVCLHWSETKSAFLGNLLGTAMVVFGVISLPGFTENFWKAYNAEIARRTGKPAADDISGQIQQERQRLESMQAAFTQDGVELTKQYQALDAQRKTLKPGDTTAITKFNEAAATYQAKNAARKLMQTQIDAAQKELDSLLDARSRQGGKSASR